MRAANAIIAWTEALVKINKEYEAVDRLIPDIATEIRYINLREQGEKMVISGDSASIKLHPDRADEK